MKKKKSKPKTSPIVSFGWMKQEFDQLHKEHAVILKRLDDIEQAVNRDPELMLLLPALEAEIKKVAAMALQIDMKVPDTNTPPGAKRNNKLERRG